MLKLSQLKISKCWLYRVSHQLSTFIFLCLSFMLSLFMFKLESKKGKSPHTKDKESSTATVMSGNWRYIQKFIADSPQTQQNKKIHS